MTLETRSLVSPLILREGGDGRTLEGVFMPFDRVADIGRYREVFRRGAFTKTLTERGDRVKVYAKHDDRSFPIGRMIEAREDVVGLVGAVRLAETARGDEALALAREGLLGFSIGFIPIPGKDVRVGDVLERREVRLEEVSLTERPAYEDAKVLALRQESADELRTALASMRAGNPFGNL